MPYIKNYIIPPSLKPFNIIRGWENGHSNSISFILSSFCIRMTIKWPKSHLEMAQNDRDGPGMKVIKMLDIWLDIMNISFIYHSVITASSCNDLSLWKNSRCVRNDWRFDSEKMNSVLSPIGGSTGFVFWEITLYYRKTSSKQLTDNGMTGCVLNDKMCQEWLMI